MPEPITTIAVIIGTVGSFLVALATVVWNLVQSSSTVKTREFEILRGVVADLEKECQRLKDDLCAAEKKIARLEAENTVLQEKVVVLEAENLALRRKLAEVEAHNGICVGRPAG